MKFTFLGLPRRSSAGAYPGKHEV